MRRFLIVFFAVLMLFIFQNAADFWTRAKGSRSFYKMSDVERTLAQSNGFDYYNDARDYKVGQPFIFWSRTPQWSRGLLLKVETQFSGTKLAGNIIAWIAVSLGTGTLAFVLKKSKIENGN